MTGERLLWFRVASHLHTTVEELAQRITFGEFLDWIAFLEWEELRHSKQDHYLASIAAEVRRGRVKHPGKVKNSDLLLKRKTAPDKSEIQASKSVWAAAVGADLKKKKKK